MRHQNQCSAPWKTIRSSPINSIHLSVLEDCYKVERNMFFAIVLPLDLWFITKNQGIFRDSLRNPPRLNWAESPWKNVVPASMLGALPGFCWYGTQGWFLEKWSQTSPETGIWKTPPQTEFVYLLEIFLNIFANQRFQEDSLGQHFFFAIRILLQLPLELNSRSFFHLCRSESLFYSRCAPFRAWKRSQARPKSAENRSPLLCRFECLQSALGKWQCLHNETSVTRSISSKSNSYFWSLVGPAPEGTPSMHRSWWSHRGACAGCIWVPQCRKSHPSWRVGLFVSRKLLATAKAHQAPNMLELIDE